MTCPDCESKCIVARKETFHFPGDKYVTERRLYVCQNERCGASFYYKNQFMERHEALNARKYIEQYQRQRERQHTLNFEDEDE